MTCARILRSLTKAILFLHEPGSSVSIVSDYRWDDRAIGVRSHAGAKNFSFNLCVQTGSEVHPISYAMGTRGPFDWAKRGRCVTLTTHPHLVPRSRMSRSYTSSPPGTTMAYSGASLLILLLRLYYNINEVLQNATECIYSKKLL
jgi:hypothetical protein